VESIDQAFFGECVRVTADAVETLARHFVRG